MVVHEVNELFTDPVWTPEHEPSLPQEPLFYERHTYQQAVGFGSLVAGSAIAAVGWYKTAAVVAAVGLGVLYYVFADQYADMELRQVFREQLDDGTLSIEEYVEKHGWDRIERFGFAIHPLHHSLLTEKELKAYLFENLKEDLPRFLNQRGLHLQLHKGFLWQCMMHCSFKPEEMEKLREIFLDQIDSLPMITVFENYPEIEQFGLITSFDSKEVIDFYQHNYKDFHKVNNEFVHYYNRIRQCYIKEKESLHYPPPIIIYQSGKPPIVMPDTKKLNIYYEKLSAMTSKYSEEFEKLLVWRDGSLQKLQATRDALLER